MSIPVKLDAFEGPLDLLLHLIEKNKINIYDIPIVTITDQYMEYINAMQEKDMEIMSEFLVIAAMLLNIKSRMLLPKTEEEGEGESEDPRTELVERLLEYKLYKYISYELKDKQFDAAKILYKPPTIPDDVKAYEEPVDLEKLLDGLTLIKLKEVFNQVIRRQVDKIDPIRSKFGEIEKEEVNLVDKIKSIDDYGRKHRSFSFKKLLNSSSSKTEIIVTFLGILELIRMGRIRVSQSELFDDINIDYNEDQEQLDENYDISFD